MARPNSSAKRTARAAERSDALVKLCHDLRQYVAAGLLLSSMPDDEQLEPELRTRLQLIHQQFLHAADLIASAGSDPGIRRSPVDLSSLVAECVDLVRVTHQVDVLVSDGDRPVIFGDPVLIRRAVANVLDNAARAAARSGTVTVSLGEDDSTAWVQVVDDGLGFGQIESGTGHGLAIVHEAVRASGGELEISSGPGSGTTVRIVLPAPLDGEQAS